MELARSEEATSDLGRTILPALNAVEGHLGQVASASAQLRSPFCDTLTLTDAQCAA